MESFHVWRVLESFGEFWRVWEPTHFETNVVGEFWRVLESFGEFHVWRVFKNLRFVYIYIYIYEKLCFLRFYDPRVLESFGEFWRVF